MPMTRAKSSEPSIRGSADAWLDAAYQNLVETGIDAVRILPIADRVNLARTSFYWFFTDRKSLLDALLERWRQKNTRNLAKQAQAYAESVAEAILNVCDCWLNPELFDSKFEFAVRNWAQQSEEVAAEIVAADQIRLDALKRMFVRFDSDVLAADVRARTIYLTQIGYISMQMVETLETRLARIPSYVEIFCGKRPTIKEFERFSARHRNESGKAGAAKRRVRRLRS
jgi:AcrR family transcriptional regulator